MTPKQQEQLAACQAVLDKYKVKVLVDPLFGMPKSPLSCDIEHDEQGNLVCIGTYDGDLVRIYTKVTDLLKTALENSELIGHNFISDTEMLRSWGINIKDEQLVHDTMLLGHIVDSSKKSYGLKDMALRELQIEYPSYDVIVGKHKGKTKDKPKCPQTEAGCCGRVTLDKQPLDLVAAYNACDCVSTFLLYERQRKEIPDYVL